MGVNTTDAIVNSVMQFGLNTYEAKLYIALLSEGTTSARCVADITGIPYGKIYETLNVLADKGFIRLVPAKPMKFQAISPVEAAEIVRKKKLEQLRGINDLVRDSLMPMYAQAGRTIDSSAMYQVLSGRSNINRKLESLITCAKESITICLSGNGLKRLVMHKEALLAACSLNVHISIASDLSSDNAEDARALSFCDIRHVGAVPVQMITVDGKDCLIVEASPDDDNIIYGRDFGMWVTSVPFVKMMESFISLQFKQCSLKPIKIRGCRAAHA